MFWNEVKSIFLEHKGKCIGSLVGLLVGVLVMLIGFWWTLFLSFCVLVGYNVGRRYDEDADVTITEVIERYFRGRQR